jgi:RND family efflux transporter MFP subunit
MVKLRQPSSWIWIWIVSLLPMTACAGFPEAEAQNQPANAQSQAQSAAVDAAIARTGALESDLEYTGTTQPAQEVSLRSQVEGRVLSITADVGDRVQQGQVLAQLDDSLPQAVVSQAQAELAAQQAEVASAQAEVSEALAQVEEARVQLQQAQTDADRLQQLFAEGAVPEQERDLALTDVRTARQALAAAQAQVNALRQAVAAAQGRVEAQRAIVAEGQERRSYTTLTAPVTGVVLRRVTEPGNLAQPGSEILRIGDFNQVQVSVPVSELDLADIRLGQSVQVRLDAFADRQFSGRVTNISPAADPTARLIPVEVTIPNADGRIGSGLLARVNFSQNADSPVIIPQTALEASGAEKATANATATIFVVQRTAEQATVVARSVRLGQQADGQVEVLSGLEPGEQFVVRSSRPLQAGESVRLSILSETEQDQP